MYQQEQKIENEILEFIELLHSDSDSEPEPEPEPEPELA